MKDIVFLKLGGSLITDKMRPYAMDRKMVLKIARQVKEAVDANPEISLLIANGAGSFGHFEADRSYEGKTGREKIRGQCLLQDSVARLNRLIVAEMLAVGLDCMSFQPSAFMTASQNDTPVGILGIALNSGIVPVVYGDPVFSEREGGVIFSSEKLFSLLAPAFQMAGHRVSRIIYAGRTQGIYGTDGKTIANINAANIGSSIEAAKAARGFDVTGGMRHKLELSWQMAREGIASVIVDGTADGSVRDALLGNPVKGSSEISAA